METKKDMTCIICPLGCKLSVKQNDDGGIHVSGNACKRGLDYGIKEYTNPERILASTVELSGSNLAARLPVRTKESIPLNKIFECMEVLKKVKVNAPIDCGEVIVKSVCDTGIDIVSTRRVE